MRRELKLISYCGTLTTGNANNAMMTHTLSLEESAFGGSLESDGQFCARAFGINVASVTVKCRIYFVKKFYEHAAASIT
jgi:hypothetical protein